MKLKKELKNLMVLETTKGFKYLVVDDNLLGLKNSLELKNYDDNLYHLVENQRGLNICKVYELKKTFFYEGLETILKDYTFYKYKRPDKFLNLIWERRKENGKNGL